MARDKGGKFAKRRRYRRRYFPMVLVVERPKLLRPFAAVEVVTAGTVVRYELVDQYKVVR